VIGAVNITLYLQQAIYVDNLATGLHVPKHRQRPDASDKQKRQ
jgi:hypothetical protein